MKTIITLFAVLATLGLGTQANANDNFQIDDTREFINAISPDLMLLSDPAHKLSKPGTELPIVCRRVKPDAQQGKAIVDAFVALIMGTFKGMKELKLLKAEYVELINDEMANFVDATVISADINATVGKMVSGKTHFNNSIFFDILKVEQRRPAMRCMMLMKKKMMKKKLIGACKKLRKGKKGKHGKHGKCKHPGHKHPGDKHPGHDHL